jgi:ParB family transcriptional regulator, chromosome partitioning protein
MFHVEQSVLFCQNGAIMAQAASTSSGSVRKRLGRGLSSLLSTPVPIEMPASAEREKGPDQAARVREHAAHSAPDKRDDASNELRMLLTSEIVPNRYQPRRQFDEAGLDALGASIREAGLMQPVVVRPRTGGGGYELIAGERRWRAAQRIGLGRIPAVIREVDHQTAAQWALIENIQREDLNAVERAEAFRRLAQEFSLTHQEIAERVGLDRTSVTNHLRLLELDAGILTMLAAGELSMGHGRSLLSITNIAVRRALADRAAKEGWSVRELERHARPESRDSKTASSPVRGLPVHIHDLQRKLGEHLGTTVRILPGKKKGSGKLTINFYSIDEFEGILTRLSFNPM